LSDTALHEVFRSEAPPKILQLITRRWAIGVKLGAENAQNIIGERSTKIYRLLSVLKRNRIDPTRFIDFPYMVAGEKSICKICSIPQSFFSLWEL